MFSFMNHPAQEDYINVCSTIIPSLLYLSGYVPANNAALLEDLSIKHVLRLGDDEDLLLYETHDDIEYHTIIIEDSLKSHLTRKMLDAAIVFIQSATSPVLIHCRAGVSRSASIAIAYMMRIQGKTYQEAKLLVKSARPCVNPNGTFLRDLQEYEWVSK